MEIRDIYPEEKEHDFGTKMRMMQKSQLAVAEFYPKQVEVNVGKLQVISQDNATKVLIDGIELPTTYLKIEGWADNTWKVSIQFLLNIKCESD